MMKNLTVENVYTRQAAKALSKKHFWKLLGMMLIVFVFTFALTWGGTFLLAKLTGEPMETVSTSKYMEMDVTQANIGFIVGYLVLMLVVTLLGGGLGLGLMSGMIDLCRGNETVKIRRVFSRMRYCLKCFLLGSWVSFKTLLWALPGLVIMYFVVGGILVAGDPHTMQATEATTAALSILPMVMMVVIFALVIPAVFRYYLSTYVLADEPATGVFDCVKQSKTMMKGHKWQCFKLTIPLYLACYAIMLGVVLVMGLLAAVLSEFGAQSEAFELPTLILPVIIYAVFVVMALVYGIRASLCYCLFYLKRKGEMPAIPPEEEERIVCWQPGVEKTPGEPVANGADEHIACWQPGGEVKPEQE